MNRSLLTLAAVALLAALPAASHGTGIAKNAKKGTHVPATYYPAAKKQRIAQSRYLLIVTEYLTVDVWAPSHGDGTVPQHAAPEDMTMRGFIQTNRLPIVTSDTITVFAPKNTGGCPPIPGTTPISIEKVRTYSRKTTEVIVIDLHKVK